jgi:hypothetical protein
MVNVFSPLLLLRFHYRIRQTGSVGPGNVSSFFCPLVQMRQFYLQNGSLYLIKAVIDSKQRMIVLGVLAVVPQ